ncbi:hypothetical protein NM208_g6954 [Fusarium decemcellulare]|uniref:Uncharacterized protein n=2 Tax=Fusarium decemcellulare TaxID=57161 RepID=A0ACC1SAY3_9HYPO|nr:hypothetical protein NM208_g8592 [Fusarium decemcellulare]KAJ3535872.1 hypothetical protein NM208_g6954 [Fusarium decemcellulare]
MSSLALANGPDGSAAPLNPKTTVCSAQQELARKVTTKLNKQRSLTGTALTGLVFRPPWVGKKRLNLDAANAVIFDVTKDSLNGCQNCTKHQVKCAYQDNLAHDEASIPKGPPCDDDGVAPRADRLKTHWPAQLRAEVRQWRRTGVSPFAHLTPFVRFQTVIYSDDELCHLYHIRRLYYLLTTMDACKLTVFSHFVPGFFRIASRSRLAMNGLLALSASQIAFSSECSFARYRACHYKAMAIRDLRKALTVFSLENADEVLAGSLTLLWLSEDWNGWSQISQGISAVRGIMDFCQDWSYGSELYDLATRLGLGRADNPSRTYHDNPETKANNQAAIQLIIMQMQRFALFLQNQAFTEKDLQRLQLLIELAQDIMDLNLSTTNEERFERMRQLRDCALWMPVNCLLTSRNLSNSLMVNVYLYAVLAQKRQLFPQGCTTETGDDLPSLLEETLNRVKMYGQYDGLIQEVESLVVLSTNLE